MIRRGFRRIARDSDEAAQPGQLLSLAGPHRVPSSSHATLVGPAQPTCPVVHNAQQTAVVNSECRFKPRSLLLTVPYPGATQMAYNMFGVRNITPVPNSRL